MNAFVGNRKRLYIEFRTIVRFPLWEPALYYLFGVMERGWGRGKKAAPIALILRPAPSKDRMVVSGFYDFFLEANESASTFAV